jgi:alpha-glucosidase (family GH31 glycosyl hydrolase)
VTGFDSLMADELSRRNFLGMLGTAGAATIPPNPLVQLFGSSLSKLPVSPTATVVRGNARFQILSPTLVRMEYASPAQFVDAPSVSVPNRNWPACQFQARDVDGWLEITTDRQTIRYKLDSGKFTPENLAVSWSECDSKHEWKPGDNDDKNLGGVPGLFDPSVPVSVTPGALSRNGYFLLDDSDTAVWNTATQWPEPRHHREAAQDWYFFIYGRAYKSCLRELAQLLGPIPMIPRYIFGTWFGSRAAYPADEWRRIVDRFHEEEIPLDLLMLDSYSTAKLIWSGFSWDPEQFPDPKGFFAWMKAKGVKVSVNEHGGPVTKLSDEHFDQVRQAMGLPDSTTKIHNNLADKKYAMLYMDVLHKPALDQGMAFWWQDTKMESNMPGLDSQFWLRHIEYQGQERLTGKRTFTFSRLHEDTVTPSKLPQWGVHRYGGFFTGDFAPYWSELENLVPINVQSGNVLVPYINSLTGSDQSVSLDHELYQRWTQFSSFSPAFWWHGLFGMRLPWEYGEECQATVKKFLTLRYHLLPYTYTYSRLAHDTGAPLVRGTYLEYPDQEPAYTFNHQYLFGESLLVSPITRAGGGKPVRKEIYLPDGEHWLDYFLGQIHKGGQVLSYECPLSRMPIFVKAGSILPAAPEMQSTDDYPLDYLILNVYAGKSATFRLYEDDGISLDYRKNSCSWTPINYSPTAAPGDHIITIGPAEGQYDAQPAARSYRINVHGLFRPARVLLQGRIIPEKRQRGNSRAEGWVWHPVERIITIDLTTPVAIGKAITVRLERAGAFADAVAIGSVRNYRDRVRRVKIAEKLFWGVLVSLNDIKKEPHVLQETDRVEQMLNDIINHGKDIAAHPVDFRKMTSDILDAFITRPFDSPRILPELDPLAAKETLSIEHVTFISEQLRNMTAELLACDLVVSATDAPKQSTGSLIGSIVHARFLYDTAAITLPQLAFEIAFPNDGPPGWIEMSRDVRPDGTATFSVVPPWPPAPGSHTLKVKAIATWGPHQVVLDRDVVWTVRSS